MIITEERVVLVNENDQEIGVEEKIEAHRKGLLHRAFSVFVFNDRGQLLLQKRALGKYHSGGLWTNTACGHPRPGEDTVQAGERRLWEEMGLRCKLKLAGNFVYKSPFSNGLTEHELDHVLIGRSNNLPDPNLEEVSDHKYMNPDDLKIDIKKNPENYTFWFKIIMERDIIKKHENFID